MTALRALAAAVLGAVVGTLVGGLPGLLAGGAIGFLIGQQLDLRKRLERVEEAQTGVEEMRTWAAEMKTWAQQTHAWLTRLAPTTEPDEAQSARTQPEAQPHAQPEAQPAEAPVSEAQPAEARAGGFEESLAPPDASTRAPQAPAPAAAGAAADRPSADQGSRPDPVEWLVNWVKRWVTTGNAPVKVGVLVSLVGVGLLLREAHRRGIIDLTIEVRLVASAAFGLVLLAVGWRQRRRRPVYGLSLQGGGIAVLYVVVYAAFAVYDVLPAVPASAAVVVVTVGAGVLSVVQDSRVLAVLGIVGGFLAPVLTYSRPEDHVYVFGFFAALNAAILGVAWFKTWPELNLLGFGFTFGLTAFWLSSRYESNEWVSTQPFVALFVLMYVAMPALFAVREAPDLKRMLDGSPTPGTPFVRGAWTAPLVFGTPFAGLGVQQLAVGHTEYGTAVSAAMLAVVQGALALAARRLGADRRQLAEAYAGLGVAFSAIAVPLALDANFTSAAWAVQGLVLVWLGCRSGRLLALVGGAVLQALAASSFAVHLGESLPYAGGTPAIVNEFFLGALLLAAAGLVSGWLLARRPQRGEADHLLEGLALGWGIAWWLGSGLMEIVQQLPEGDHLSAALAFVAGSFVVGSLSARRLRWPHLEAAGVLIVPTLAVALLVSLATQSHPLDRWGWAAWPAAFAAHWLFLRRRAESFSSVAALLHAVGFWTLAALVAREVYWQVDRVADGVWPLAATAAAALVLAGATMAARPGQSWPVGVHWRTFLLACAGPLLAVAAAVVLAAAVLHEGDPRPLLFLPVLNPLGVLVGMQLAASLAWRRMAGAQPDHPFRRLVDARWTPALAVLGLVLATTETARTVSHWLDVPWDVESLWDSTELQASLSILWAVIALSGMVAGVRTALRPVWVAGASWMAVVVAKLFLVDLSSLSALSRVVSFIVVGVLLLIVGYLAPVPPAAPADSEEEERR